MFGLYAFYINRVVHSTALSAIIAATRSPKLEVLAGGNVLRDMPLGEDIRKAKLGLGVLRAGIPGEERITLGRAGEVKGLRKGASIDEVRLEVGVYTEFTARLKIEARFIHDFQLSII